MMAVYRYRLPFKKPFELAGMSMQEREGLLLRLRKDGLDLYSEIAPLPRFSVETVNESLEILLGVTRTAEGHFREPDDEAWSSWVTGSKLPASVRFGLDVMMQQIMASTSAKPLHRYLNPAADDDVGSNAVLGLLPPAEMERATYQLLEEGFRTIKYKVENPEPYLETWMRIRARFPSLKMRFDANGSWPLHMAEPWAKRMEPLVPDYVEQPLRVGLEAEMAEMQQRVAFPIAFDESARDLNSIDAVLAMAPAATIILKPMLIGSVAELAAIIDRINQVGAAFTITTLIESGIGRNAVAGMAAAFGPPGHDHGLGTGSLLAEDVVLDLQRHGGTFRFDANLGSRVNKDFLETFRIV